MYLLLGEPLPVRRAGGDSGGVKSSLQTSKVILDQVDFEIEHLLGGSGTVVHETRGNSVTALKDDQTVRERFRRGEQRRSDEVCNSEHSFGGAPDEELLPQLRRIYRWPMASGYLWIIATISLNNCNVPCACSAHPVVSMRSRT